MSFSFKKSLLAAFPLLLALPMPAAGPTLQKLTNQPAKVVGLCFQMTDGSVLCQGGGIVSSTANLANWYRLTPDNSGSYLNGTWKQVAGLPAGYEPDAYASAVLADGRLVIIGGEYNKGPFSLTNKGAIYDPIADTWTPIGHPAGWGFVGDSPSLVLPNGQFLVGQKITMEMAALDPKTLTWTAVASPGKADFNSEEGWTLLPDGSILTADVKNSPNSERYFPAQAQWTSEGNTPVNLRSVYHGKPIPYGPHKKYTYDPPGEIGPAILRPDGTVFFTGASNTPSKVPGQTAIYHPGATPGAPGTWTTGPSFVKDAAGDEPGALLPNGNVVVMGNSGYLWEFDGTNLKRTLYTFATDLMVLPTGQVLVSGGGRVDVYTSTGTYDPAWAPGITTFPSKVTRGTTYKISGTQFNGLSQAAAFGDEYETATNYPLVRITNTASGHVFYARTHDHSTMGVATGTALVFTHFDVPAGMETGASRLEVVANGIPSTPVSITVN